MDKSILLLILIGLTAGFASGLFGIGGGVLIVPALMTILGFSLTRATGTSLVVLLPPVGIGAVLEYARHGQVDWKAAIFIAGSLFLGALLGALVANRLPVPSLRLVFGLFVIGVGLHITSSAVRGVKPEANDAAAAIHARG